MHLGQVTSIGLQSIQFIWSMFEHQLKNKQLMQYFPQYNMVYTEKILTLNLLAQQKVKPFYSIKIQQPHSSKPLNQNLIFVQEQPPKTIGTQCLCNFLIKVNSPDKGHNKSLQRLEQLSNKERKTATPANMTKYSNWNKSANLYTEMKQPAIPLQKKQKSAQQIEQQLQADNIKKKLYFQRKSLIEEQQNEQKRIQNLKKRKSPQLPKTEFTFNYNGQFLKKKNNTEKSGSLVQQLSFSANENKQQKKKVNISLDHQTKSSFFNTKNSFESKYKKMSLFNNSNKRQVSHLPFIKLVQDSKIIENQKTSLGNLTERKSKLDYTTSIEQRSFKHHMETQKQKSLLTKLQRYKEDNHIQNQEEIVKKQIDQPQLFRHKQSYRMKKYLKTLGKQRQQIENLNLKSSNFERINFPQTTSIYKYYKHDFEKDKTKMIQYQYLNKSLQGGQ